MYFGFLAELNVPEEKELPQAPRCSHNLFSDKPS